MKEPRVNLSDRRSLPNKKVNVKYTLKRLLSYLKPTLPLFIVVFLGNLLSVVLSLLGPYVCGLAVGEIKADGTTDFNAITYYCIILAVVYVASELINYATTVGMAYVARKMTNRMRGDLFKKLVHLPVGYFDNRQAGDVISVLSYDIDTVGASLANDVVLVLKSAVLIIGSLVMMLVIAAPLVAVFAVTVPLSLIITRIITKKVQPLYRKRSAKLGELNGFAEEVLAGQKTTKAYNREEEILQRFQTKNETANDAYTTAEYYGTISGPCVNLVNNLSLTLVSVLGALMFAFGWGGVGISQISSFVLYSRKFSGPINEIANVIGEFQSSIAAAERVFTVLEARAGEREGEGAAKRAPVGGDGQIDGVNFGYLPGKPVLKNFSLHAERGNVIAIVGKTGAGKTTVINLLMRFYDADSGCIKIDGHDITGVTRSSLRGAFTMVLQDTWLFAGTVYENIAYGAENVTREQVEEVCKKARIHSFITRLPQGYDTLLTDNAVNISKGQKQLLTIARAMLSPSPMLILDEATSNVDTRTEQIIQGAMTELMKGKTCFVIAHRLSTIKNADKILVMDGGNAVEQGTHSELMAKRGYYYRLYN
ncbi:MAG: ABC transporter ATP-binding protein/permease, partial [Clostridia bacterium]|nr:ABC transporter ATP-binding protein/permease [Clostridia bacterium]